MLKRIGFWLAFCIAFGQGGILLADVVSRADARIAAANWTRDEAFSSDRPNGSPSDVQTVMSDGREIVHVVSFGDGGWVVTSTDDRLEPVLAFSKSGSVETLLATPFVDIRREVRGRAAFYITESADKQKLLHVSPGNRL